MPFLRVIAGCFKQKASNRCLIKSKIQQEVIKKDSKDQQVLNIDEAKYADDADMMYMIHMLTAAAADSEMREDMNVEDEYYKAIEDRDTAIMERDKTIKERAKQIKQQNQQLQLQTVQLQLQTVQLQHQGEQLQAKEEQLRNMAKALSANGMSVSQIAVITGLIEADVEMMLKG